MEFTLTHPDVGPKSILLLFDGVPYLAYSDHPWWDEIVDLALEDDPRVLDLFALYPPEPDEVETKGPVDEKSLFDDLELFFDLRGIDPSIRAEKDYSEEELDAIRRIYDFHGVPTCEDLECGFLP